MSLFVDTSAWYAAADRADRSHERAKAILSAGERIAANPWGEGASTLEWSVSSPPPFHSFDDLPEIR